LPGGFAPDTGVGEDAAGGHPLRLYDYLSSGNGYKCRLLLRQLKLPFERIELDIMENQTRTPEYLAKNPNGKIPLLELDDGRCLAESDAIIWYLADGTRFLPDDRFARAEVLQWMFFEQYSHEPNIATSRFIVTHLPSDSPRRGELARKKELGDAALAVMERHLAGRDFFVEGRYTIADIALYAYTHVADEGGFDLAAYPAIGRWLARVRQQPGHTRITEP
jgi:glutathione S-transferase